jgi:hypothetical protein
MPLKGEKTTRHRLLILAAAAACVFVVAAEAPTIAARAGLSLNPAVGSPTTLTKAKGAGYAAGELVALFFDGVRVDSAIRERTLACASVPR